MKQLNEAQNPSHTPGPWKLSPHHRAILQDKTSIDGCCITIANMPLAPAPRGERQYNQANARLMTAAPELLDLAVAIYNLDKDGGPNIAGPVWRDMVSRITTQAKHAIAKVRGLEI